MEGTTKLPPKGPGKDRLETPYTAADFRFTQKAGGFYAIALDWPADGVWNIKSLAKDAGVLLTGDVCQVSLLGSAEKLDWKQTATGLEIHAPCQRPCDYAYTFKIEAFQNAHNTGDYAIHKTVMLGIIIVTLRSFIIALIVVSTASLELCGAAQVSSVNAGQELYVRTFGSDQKIRIELVDHLKLPAIGWPRTLLSYPVRFVVPVRPEQLVLRDLGHGADIPFQLSDIKSQGGRLQFAVVNFFADLPSSGSRQFELSVGKPVSSAPGVRQIIEGDTVVLDAGKIKVRLPASRGMVPGQQLPGPILQLNRGSGWLGDATLVSPKLAVKSITTETIDSGPLFITCRVTYQFADGASYAATIKAIADYDFIEFSEEMKGLSRDDGVYVENAWTNFHPTHRFSVGSPFGGTRKIDEPMMQPFRGEDPAFTGPSRVEDPTVEMLPSLTPYWPNGWGGNREAAFWDERTGDAVGLFLLDAAKWQDHEYAIWTSADTLKVKYRFANGVLFWKWPLVTGTRVTGLTIYHHGVTAAQKPPADQTAGATLQDEMQSAIKQKELPQFLRIYYDDISLNRVKDWQLTYPETAKRPSVALKPGRQKSVADYMTALPGCAMMEVANGMFHPVGLRDMGYWVVPDFQRFRDAMTAEQRSQATAALLFAAYISAEDEFSPMQTMLGGHPNFMADLKFPLAAAAFLFPDHPMAQEWRDQYAKFMELCGHFYVRPAVPQWEARGGRFTESIATYNWAFMEPTSEANWMGLQTGAHNVYATPELADMGDYLVGVLTAPVTLDTNKINWPDNTALTWENGFKRIHPPQGAHSGKRGVGGSMFTIGEQLQNYRPLTAEHMMWGAFPSAGQGFEDRQGEPVAGPVNRGTNPHFTSAKYTGYGIVLRAGVDTADEISVFLQQVDKGPNYRWGYANQNGSGDIYYYAKGKSFSGHGFEDTGDRHADDALYSCNTGVYKNYHFNSIGMNELTRPFYNLDVAQFAELVPQRDAGAYSWPEYQSRSVMLVGTEYIVTYDAILEPCGTRFAWNIGANDDMPFIQHIKGGAENIMDTSSRARDQQRGVLYDVWKGGGDRMMLVTHLPGVKVIPPKRVRGEPLPAYCRVQTPTSEDLVFQDSKEINWHGEGIIFQGTAGVIRQRRNHQTELALFHGTQIGNHEVTLAVNDPDLGVSAAYTKPSELAGECFGRKGGLLTLKTPGAGTFYLDGARLAANADGTFTLPPGQHRWEYTGNLPEPLPPTMRRTENHNGGAKIFFTTVAGAEKYRLELSQDNGVTWQRIGETTSGEYDLTALANGIKVHVRAVALNASRESRPAGEYPLYVTDQPPPPPSGLKLEVGSQQVKATWGEVLGVTEYRLYRRVKGAGKFQEICHGLRNSYLDTGVNVIPAFTEPGQANNLLRDASGYTVYEYAVAAVNGNGAGKMSLPVDTDPTSWRNWNPTGDLRFKRQTAFWQPPFVEPKDVPPMHYEP